MTIHFVPFLITDSLLKCIFEPILTAVTTSQFFPIGNNANSGTLSACYSKKPESSRFMTATNLHNQNWGCLDKINARELEVQTESMARLLHGWFTESLLLDKTVMLSPETLSNFFSWCTIPRASFNSRLCDASLTQMCARKITSSLPLLLKVLIFPNFATFDSA